MASLDDTQREMVTGGGLSSRFLSYHCGCHILLTWCFLRTTSFACSSSSQHYDRRVLVRSLVATC